jgi:type II secretory pathway pseudopilin PulG
MRRGERGFAYVAVLALVAVMGIGLAAIGPLWAQESQRERETELLRLGQLYAEAISRYYATSPGSIKQHPPQLEALLLDTRFVGTVRHLRTLYSDPITDGKPWGLMRAPDGGVIGIYSQSGEAPLHKVPVKLGKVTLAPASRYSDWKFIAKVD